MGHKRFTDVELITALNMHEGNVTHAAKELNVTRAAVIKRRDVLPKGALLTDMEEFKARRGDVFADLQMKVLQNITPDKLNACSAQQLTTIMAILYDKERLEQNLSTENVAHQMGQNMTDEDKAFFKEFQEKRTAKMRKDIAYDDDG